MSGTSYPTARYVTGQAVDATICTPSDTTTYAKARGLYIGTGGTVTVVTADAFRESQITGVAATPVPFVNMPSGSFLGLHIYKVMATGTTALNINVIY